MSNYTLTEEDYKSIMYPAIKATLSTAGIASNLSTEFRDEPIGSRGAS